MFTVVSMTVGMKYAAVAYSVLSSLTLLSGNNRVRIAAFTGLIVSVFVFGLADQVMHVIWPEPILTNWFLARG